MIKFQDVWHYHQEDGNADIRIVYDPSNNTIRIYMAEMINGELQSATCVIPSDKFRELRSKI